MCAADARSVCNSEVLVNSYVIDVRLSRLLLIINAFERIWAELVVTLMLITGCLLCIICFDSYYKDCGNAQIITINTAVLHRPRWLDRTAITASNTNIGMQTSRSGLSRTTVIILGALLFVITEPRQWPFLCLLWLPLHRVLSATEVYGRRNWRIGLYQSSQL